MACVSSTSGSGAASSSSGSGMTAAQRATSAPEPDLFARGPDDPPRGTTAARLDLPLDLTGDYRMIVELRDEKRGEAMLHVRGQPMVPGAAAGMVS